MSLKNIIENVTNKHNKAQLKTSTSTYQVNFVREETDEYIVIDTPNGIVLISKYYISEIILTQNSSDPKL